MAPINRRSGIIYSPLLAITLLIACVAGTVYEAYGLYRTAAWNRLIADPPAIGNDEGLPAAVLFAKALHMERRGRSEEALRLYNEVENSQDASMRERARYNIGGIYLSEAAKLLNNQGVWAYPQVSALVDLAEQEYKEVLRANPRNWNARFNLEYALRIKPPPKEAEKADWTGRKSSVFALMPGIPGGGP
ncbi:MAG: MxaK protein [Pseudomonadota bacterium]